MKSVFKSLVCVSLLALAFGTSAQQSTIRMHVPFLPDTPGVWQTFIRMVGATGTSTRFTFRLFNMDGSSAGSYVLDVPRTSLGAARHVNGDDFKRAGAPRGPWSAFIDMSPRGLSTPAVYLRTATGFVTPLHNTGEWLSRSDAALFSNVVGRTITYGEYQWTLNPGRNTNQVGMVHVAALGLSTEVFIIAYDDTGETFAIARIPTMRPYERSWFTSAQLENVTGETGVGKWRLILLGTRDFTSQTGIYAREDNIYAASSPQTENVWEISGSSSASPSLRRSNGRDDSVSFEELTAVPSEDLPSDDVKVLPPDPDPGLGQRPTAMPSGGTAASPAMSGPVDLPAAVLHALESAGADPEDFPMLESVLPE